MLQDIRFAARTLLKNPAFTLAAVLCLGLGIGVNATIYSCARAVLLRPFPYHDPDRLVAVGEENVKRGWHMNSVSYANFRSWQAENRTFESMAIGSGASYNLASGDGAEYVQGAVVSWTTFHMLGVKPVLGRDFREEEDRVGAPNVAILSDKLWHDKFDGRRDAIGREIRLNDRPYTIIGVMPPNFEFPYVSRLWTTVQLDPLQNRGNHSWQVIGRLKPGVTMEQVERDVKNIASSLSARYPESNTGWSAEVKGYRDNEMGDFRPMLLIMTASVAFVLLIACANVANLLLARATTRAKEMGVRAALGASRWRVVRQLLTESILIALLGAVLGLAFAYAFLKWVVANILGGLPFWMRFTIDAQVLLFTMAVAIGTGVLFGLVPALQSARPNLNETLRDAGARGTSASRARQRLRGALVIGEVALSLVLLVGASLLIRSFLELQRVQPGFDTSHLLTMRVSLDGPKYDSMYKRAAFWDRVLPEIANKPGVASASIVNTLPLSGGNNNSSIVVEGQPVPLGQDPVLEIRYVSPTYLETMRIPLRRGRMFNDREWADTTVGGRVAVINEFMAKRFWPDQDAIGKRFKFGNAADTLNRWVTVIGIAADVKHKRLNSAPDLQAYMSYRQGGWKSSAIVVRTRGEPAQATSSVLDAIHQVDPKLPAFRVMSMEAVVRESYWPQMLYGKMFFGFAVIALVLAAVGVYGVISYAVSQRTQEIGVRVALGAQRTDVLGLVVRDGALMGGVGVLIGLAGALGVTRFLRSSLYGVSPFDAATFVGVSLLLIVITLIASYVPARRAALVDPIEALRYE